ncbi:MAG: PKD-like domain-containing protein [Dysgonomonas sp.]|nr:PKD-like domain-containing protein [Dysgonomonas sp.]
MKRKHIIHVLCLIFFGLLSPASFFSQVTVGTGSKAAGGALLQLKENDNTGVNSTRGLMLPRVALISTTDQSVIDGGASQGLTVYNVTDNMITSDVCPGVYTWNTNRWTRLHDPCAVQCDNNINVSSVAQTICLGEAITPVTFTTSGSSIALSGTASGLTVNNNNTSSVTISGTPTTAGTYAFAAATAGTVNCPADRKTFTLTVNPRASVNKPANITYCNGDAVNAMTFASLSPTGATFDWTNSNTAIGLAAGATNASQLPAFTATNSGNTPLVATITITPKYGNCPGIAQTFTITVNPTASVSKPANVAYCNGDAVSAMTFASLSPTGATFDWSNSNTAIGLGTSGTNASQLPSFTATNSGNTAQVATITITPKYGNCPGIAQAFTITVNPTASVSKPANIAYCNGDAAPAMTFASLSPTGATFDWTNSNTAIGLSSGGTSASQLPSFTATNSGNTALTAIITITPKYGNCPGTAQTFTITVNPKPALTDSNVTICNGGSYTYTPTGSIIPAGIKYSWSATAPSGVAGISGDTDQDNFSTGVLTNNTREAKTVVYTVTPKYGICPGNNFTINVTVQPSAAPFSTAQTINACGKADLTALSIPAAPTGYSLKWYNNADNTLVSNSASVDPGVYYARYIASNDKCPSDKSALVTVTDVSPATPDISDQEICGGTTDLLYALKNIPAGVDIQWYIKGNATPVDPAILSNVGPGTYIVSYTSGSCTTSKEVKVTDITPAKPQVSQSEVMIATCGATINLNSYVTSSQPANTTIEWHKDGNLITGTAITQAVAGDYMVSYIRTYNGTNRCVSSTPIKVTDPNTPQVTTNPLIACQGDEAILKATAPAGFTIRWYDKDDNLIGTGNQFSLGNALAAGTYYYYAKATNGSCESAKAEAKVSINASNAFLDSPIALDSWLYIPAGGTYDLNTLTKDVVVPDGYTAQWTKSTASNPYNYIPMTEDEIKAVPAVGLDELYYQYTFINGPCNGKSEQSWVQILGVELNLDLCASFMYRYQYMDMVADFDVSKAPSGGVKMRWYIKQYGTSDKTYRLMGETTTPNMTFRLDATTAAPEFAAVPPMQSLRYTIRVEAELSDGTILTTDDTWTHIYIGGVENGNGKLLPVPVKTDDGRTIYMAHVNLGDETELNACLIAGELYQWGRTDDGHQRRNLAIGGNLHDIAPDGLYGVSGSAIAPVASLDAGGQIKEGDSRYGKFIKVDESEIEDHIGNAVSSYLRWNYKENLLNTSAGLDAPYNVGKLWGNGTMAEDVAKQPGDPCPTGWKVPSMEQWKSIYNTTNPIGSADAATANKWTWTTYYPANRSSYYPRPGYIVGGSLFLPIAGLRSSSGGQVAYFEVDKGQNISANTSQGAYWSSTNVNDFEESESTGQVKLQHENHYRFNYSYRLFFRNDTSNSNSGEVYLGTYNNTNSNASAYSIISPAEGQSVRCIQCTPGEDCTYKGKTASKK